MLSDPMDAYLRAGEAMRQNKLQKQQQWGQLGQGLGDLGQGIAQIGQVDQQKKQKAQWAQTINQMMMDPKTPPQVKQMLPMMLQRPEMADKLPSMLDPQKQADLNYTLAQTTAMKNKPDEIAASLEEKKIEAENRRQLQMLQMQTNQLLAAGKLEEAKAKIEETKAAIAQKAADAKAARTLRAQSENSKHPIYKLFHSGKGPVDEDGGSDIQVQNFTVSK